MSDQLLWFTTRGAGIVSLILLTAVVCLGITTAIRWQSSEWPRFLTAQLHRNIALLSVAFVAVHVVTSVIDPFTSLGWAAALIPFSSYYRTIWLGLGVISMELTLAVIVTSLLRDRIGRRVWRTVHWLSYAAWPLGVVHGFGTGSDATAVWMLAIQGGCVLAVGLCVIWRLETDRSARRRAEIDARGDVVPWV